MKVFPDFADELRDIDPRLTVVQNPNRPQIANIKLDGIDICPIPAFEIQDAFDPNYTIELPNGSRVNHRSKTEAIAYVKHILGMIKTQEGHDAFYRQNGY